MEYQPFQLLPFYVLFFTFSFRLLYLGLVGLAASQTWWRRGRELLKLSVCALLILANPFLWEGGFSGQKMNAGYAAKRKLAEQLAASVKGDRVIFQAGPVFDNLNAGWVPGYPQPHPVFEVYTQAPILSFTSSQALVNDLAVLYGLGRAGFTAVIVGQFPYFEELLGLLHREGFSVSDISVENRSVFVLRVDNRSNRS